MHEYKVAITLVKPKVKFRESIKKRIETQGKYKKQSGGHGQYGDVKIILEPSGDIEQRYVFEEKIFAELFLKTISPRKKVYKNLSF